MITIQESKHLKLFKGIDSNSIKMLLHESTLMEAKPGQIIIAFGATNKNIYLLLEGRLCVQLDNEGLTKFIIEAGDNVGEISVIDNGPASAKVVAETHCRLIVTPEQSMWRLLQNSHRACINLLNTLSSRLRASSIRLSDSDKRLLQLENIACIDPMTKLYNRRWLDQNFSDYLEAAVASNQLLSVLMIDLDHFKKFNDHHGHLSGDRVITVIAQTILKNLRPTDRIVRYGGDEFLALLPNTTQDDAYHVANDLCRTIKKTNIISTNTELLPNITISIGSATMKPMTQESHTSIIERADTALYKAKAEGRNRATSADL